MVRPAPAVKVAVGPGGPPVVGTLRTHPGKHWARAAPPSPPLCVGSPVSAAVVAAVTGH